MKATIVSYKTYANRKLMLQYKRKSAIKNDRPKKKFRRVTTVV